MAALQCTYFAGHVRRAGQRRYPGAAGAFPCPGRSLLHAARAALRVPRPRLRCTAHQSPLLQTAQRLPLPKKGTAPLKCLKNAST